MSEVDNITGFYCKRQNNGYLELMHQNEIHPKCQHQCVNCACDVGDHRKKTKELNKQS